MQSAYCSSIMTKNILCQKPGFLPVFTNHDFSLLMIAEPCRSRFLSHYLGPQDEWQFFGMRQHVYWGRTFILLVWHRTKSICWGMTGLCVVVRRRKKKIHLQYEVLGYYRWMCSIRRDNRNIQTSLNTAGCHLQRFISRGVLTIYV